MGKVLELEETIHNCLRWVFFVCFEDSQKHIYPTYTQLHREKEQNDRF